MTSLATEKRKGHLRLRAANRGGRGFSDPTALVPEALSAVDFNTILESIYVAAGDPVADVESAFSTTDTTPVGGIPLNAVRICQWTWMCAPPPLGPNIHANTAGYGVIAHAFENILGP